MDTIPYNLSCIFKSQGAWIARMDGNIQSALESERMAEGMWKAPRALRDECDKLARSPGTTVCDWLRLESEHGNPYALASIAAIEAELAV